MNFQQASTLDWGDVVDAQATPRRLWVVPELSALQVEPVEPFQERIVPLSPTALHTVVDGQATS